VPDPVIEKLKKLRKDLALSKTAAALGKTQGIHGG